MPSPPHSHEHENEVCPFAQTNFRGRTQRFGIKTDDRRRHMYLIGKTGMGKTSMLEQLAYHDIKVGHGVAYIDPHGDTADKLLDHIPPSRINDVIYFNPADLDWPIAFNVLEHVEGNQKHLVASGLIGIFKKIWSDSWGPRLEYVLRNAILALMDYPGTTLLGIMRILVDKEYRRKVVAAVQDPVVKSFWVDEYARYPDKFQTEAIAPIQNKVGQFLSSPLVRNIVGQVKSTVRISEIMDNRKILIMNLAKGGVGEDNSALLGAMMVTKIYLAAMERVRIAEKDRQDFYLYVDEFQNFATDSFADILSEARKYRLNLVIAHQYIGQLMTDTSTRVRDAVYGNVGTIVTFRIGAQDAEFLEPEFMPTFEQEDLVNLPKWGTYTKLMINGITSDPFSAGTLPPIDVQYQSTGNREKVINQSRERYTTPRADIELKIAKWTGMVASEEGDDDGSSEGEMLEGAARAASDKAKELTRDLPKGGGGAPVLPLRGAGGVRGGSGGSPLVSAAGGVRGGSSHVDSGSRTAPPRPASLPSAERGRPIQHHPTGAGSRGGGVQGGVPRKATPGARSATAPPRPSPPSPVKEHNAGGWYRQALREGGGAGGGMASEKTKPEQRIVECASCGGGATVFFTPRPGQRVRCENCLRAEKEKKKMEEVERAARERKTQNAERRTTGEVRTGMAPAPVSPPPPGRGRPIQHHPTGAGSRGGGEKNQSKSSVPPAVDAGEPVTRSGDGKTLSLDELYTKAQKNRPVDAEKDEDNGAAPAPTSANDDDVNFV